jgi:hypothetical protein
MSTVSSLSQSMLPSAVQASPMAASASGSAYSGLSQGDISYLVEMLQYIEQMLAPYESQLPPGTLPTVPTSPTSPSSPSSPTTGTAPSLPGATDYNNLQENAWKSNTNASQIGGTGKDVAMTITPGKTMSYDSTMGAYGDSLASQDVKFSPNDTTFQTNYTFDPSSSTMKNTQALENDLVVTNKNGQHAVFGSQFNLAEKAPTGECYFQTWNTQKGQWENAALVPIPKAGDGNTVSLKDTMNSNGTYSYSAFNYDGKTYNLSNNTFADTTSNWTKNEAVWQIQEDANAHGGPVDETYSNMQLQTA